MVKRTTTGRRSAYQNPPNAIYKLPKNLIRKVEVFRNEVSLFVNEVLMEGYGPSVVINLKAGARNSLAIDLTELSLPELVALQDLVVRGFELATPIVKRRDEIANESRDSESPLIRAYRTLPPVFARPGESDLDGESLLRRPVDPA